MKHEVFVKETELLFDKCLEIMNTKGVEYAAGEDDKFANFKRIARKFKCTPELVCAIYLQKHLDSIDNYVSQRHNGKTVTELDAVLSEPIRLRIADAINYLTILLGIIAENQVNIKTKFEGVTQNEEA